MSAEPRWLTRRIVDVIHAALLAEHGGASGVRDEALIDSALARPLHRLAYEPASDLASLAAAYLFGLVKNHGYVDGNKRVGFAVAATFLLLNGHALTASEQEAYEAVVAVAGGEMQESELAEWMRPRVRAAGAT